MGGYSKPVDPRCNKFCRRNCSEFHFTDVQFQEKVLSDCTYAHTSCDCRHFYEVPVFWILSLSFGFAFLLVIYRFIVRKKNSCGRIKHQAVVAEPIAAISVVGQTLPMGMDASSPPFIGAAPVPQVYFRKPYDTPSTSFPNSGF